MCSCKNGTEHWITVVEHQTIPLSNASQSQSASIMYKTVRASHGSVQVNTTHVETSTEHFITFITTPSQLKPRLSYQIINYTWLTYYHLKALNTAQDLIKLQNHKIFCINPVFIAYLFLSFLFGILNVAIFYTHKRAYVKQSKNPVSGSLTVNAWKSSIPVCCFNPQKSPEAA